MTSRIRSASSPRPGSAPEIVNGSATFSVTSRSGIRLKDWKTNPVRSRRSFVAASSDSWLIVSPWIYGNSDVSAILWNDIIVGVVVLVLSAWSALAQETLAR